MPQNANIQINSSRNKICGMMLKHFSAPLNTQRVLEYQTNGQKQIWSVFSLISCSKLFDKTNANLA